MSVRERLFLRTGRSATEVAGIAADLLGGRAEVRDGNTWLLIDTVRLVPGTQGEFGGPVLAHSSEAPFRPDGEFEAVDAYTVEIRLWQTRGPRADDGRDVEALAASAVFAALSAVVDFPMIHVRDDDQLARASLPGHGAHEFPAGTTIYDCDEATWNGYVVRER